PRPYLLAPQGRPDARAHRERVARGAPEERLRHRLLAPYRQKLAVGDERPPRLLPRQHVRPDGRGRPGILPQANELPLPHPDAQNEAPLLPRTALALGRTRHGVPLRAFGCAARSAARARL